ncbi:MAG TPA: hypothetical protein VMD59_13400 [Acidimicrobiales bacterium]|nr:hypothetical protein [Acidimicrobiales bacterium]
MAIVILVLLAPFVVGWVKILQKAGYSGWWILLGLVPVVGLVMFLVFAFGKWPALEARRASAPVLPPYPGHSPPTSYEWQPGQGSGPYWPSWVPSGTPEQGSVQPAATWPTPAGSAGEQGSAGTPPPAGMRPSATWQPGTSPPDGPDPARDAPPWPVRGGLACDDEIVLRAPRR